MFFFIYQIVSDGWQLLCGKIQTYAVHTIAHLNTYKFAYHKMMPHVHVGSMISISEGAPLSVIIKILDKLDFKPCIPQHPLLHQ